MKFLSVVFGKGAPGALFLVLLLAAYRFDGSKPTIRPTIFGEARFKDGDSGYVGATKIRLRCINAAEYGTQPGRAAARFAWREINGQNLVCTRRQKSLSYGRIVVSCVFKAGPHQGRNVNRFLVASSQAAYISRSCAAEAARW